MLLYLTGTDGPPGKSMVIGRPILLALEDIDGSPSFLEKALRFIEDHGIIYFLVKSFNTHRLLLPYDD